MTNSRNYCISLWYRLPIKFRIETYLEPMSINRRAPGSGLLPVPRNHRLDIKSPSEALRDSACNES